MKLSRREFIGIGLGGLGGVLACACGGVAIAAYLITKRDNTTSSSADIPSLATSDANRQAAIKLIDKPAITPREAWGALAPNHEAQNETGFYSEDNIEGWRVYEGDIRDVYKTLIVHHSVIDEGEDIATLQEIQTLHRLDRGWADVAYHYFIGKEGTVYEGRAINARGVHVAGFNTGSLGVCLLGNFMESTPSDAQWNALTQLTKWLAVRLQLTHLAGHRDFNDFTECPGDNVEPLLTQLAADAGLLFGTAGYDGPTPVPEDDETSG